MTSSVATSASTKTKGTVALILGIVSVVTFWLPIVALIAGIIAVVFGFLSRKQEPGARTFSLWGLILGFVGIALSIVMFIVNIVLVAQVVNGAS